MTSSRKRFCFALATKFGPSKAILKQEQWANFADIVQKVKWEKMATSWRGGEFSGEKTPDFCENPAGKMADFLHSNLDALPQNGGHEYLLDILWITDTLPSVKKLPPCLFGALKRAVEWHGAAIYVVYGKLDAKTNTSYIQAQWIILPLSQAKENGKVISENSQLFVI